MKLPKAKITRFDEGGETEILRSELSIGFIEYKIRSNVKNLKNFVRATQKGERLVHIQTQKFINRYSGEQKSNSKITYHLYLKAVEYTILELYRMVEIYHHEFIAHVIDDYEIDLSRSPKFDECKKLLKEAGIYISKINGFESVLELRNITNDLKHAFIQEYSLSKTINLKSFRQFDRKMLVEMTNKYLSEVPAYILNLAEEINMKYPKI
ncbi:MAG: hypothetical protein K9H64_10340 [Bacteroidales bacterium]|nr:hypothetical protein [Bacteroidales bacterium]MCF8456267.1 hypothetical protein [Bacteroidales bacterium]